MKKLTDVLFKRYFLILPAIIFFSVIIHAQESYYIKGRATIKNIKIITLEGTNPHYTFAILNKEKATRWGPEQVDVYKKNYGNVFISREVEEGHFAFLEELETGTLSLYYLKDRNLQTRFFLKRLDGTFIEMSNDTRKSNHYVKVLRAEWTGCDRLDRYIKETTYSKASMTRIVKSHNTCKRLINPRVTHSVWGGVGYTNYIVANSRNVKSAVPIGGLHQGEYHREPSYFLGYNMEVPVQSTNTSVLTGLRLHKIDMDYFTLLGFGEISFIIQANTMDLGIPLGILHNVLIGNMKSFVSFSFIPSYQILDDVLVSFNVSEPGGVTKTTTSDFSTAKFAFSSTAAVGVKIPYKENKELALKIGYDLRLGTGNSRLFNVSSAYIQIGYTL